MTETPNNNNSEPDNAEQQLVQVSTWVTVNTSTTENVIRMEISKSDDYDRVVKTR